MTDKAHQVASHTMNESQMRSQAKKRLAIRHGEISKVSFWISQVFMLIATVLGVYLAGQQGLKQAVIFEQIQSDRSNYYLRKSLQHELADNLALIEEYADSLTGISIHAARRHNLDLDTFVWETMKYSPATLETPSTLLSESRQFYRKVNDTYEKIQSGYHHPEYGRKLLVEIVDHMESNVLPLFESDTQVLKDALAKKKVSL